jgi:enoyl-CoA hydratase
MDSIYENILVEKKANGILWITLNRPEKLNALNDATLMELGQAFTWAAEDRDIKGLLITGKGKAFCAGADISRLVEMNAINGKGFAEQGQRVFNQLENLGKPSIMAINGYAFGGGCELAMAGTLRVASHLAQLGQPEIKLGIIPGYGGTQRLTRLVGKGRALDLCLTGRIINTEEALHWGLINRLVSPEELLEKSEELLQSIIEFSPGAIRATLESIHQGCDLPLPEALKIEADHFSEICGTADKTEGVRAFLEKRKAVFKGN